VLLAKQIMLTKFAVRAEVESGEDTARPAALTGLSVQLSKTAALPSSSTRMMLVSADESSTILSSDHDGRLYCKSSMMVLPSDTQYCRR
jgi:hypothetical protein